MIEAVWPRRQSRLGSRERGRPWARRPTADTRVDLHRAFAILTSRFVRGAPPVLGATPNPAHGKPDRGAAFFRKTWKCRRYVDNNL